jgi:uncharacterized protein YndB with AHSA1/START domain
MTDYNVEVTRTVAAPVATAYAAWTESDLVKQWWGPTGFTCPVARMDVREGGVSLVAMRAPAEFGGGDLYNTWAYSLVVPRSARPRWACPATYRRRCRTWSRSRRSTTRAAGSR